MSTNKKCVLVLGGARSGKSSFAQMLASRLGNRVLFVATGVETDEEMKQKIEEHRASRPEDWRTLEVSEGVGGLIMKQINNCKVVLLDSISFLMSNLIYKQRDEYREVKSKIEVELKGLLECIDRLGSSFVIVSDEVGMGVIPKSRMGRIYRDALGDVNRRLAERADEVYLVISGIPVRLKPMGVRV